jgi:hypothetical protein
MYCHSCGKSNPKSSKFCQRCGINFSTIAKSLRSAVKTKRSTIDTLTPNEEPYPYVISIKKLIILFIITGSIYQFVWFYKHFRSFKYELDWNNNSVLRALFSDFMAYSLFRRVETANRELDSKKKLYSGILALLFFACLGLSFLPSYYTLLYFICIFTLIPVQKAINYYWETKYPNKVERSEFGGKNIAWSIVGGFGWILTILALLYQSYGIDKNGNDTFFTSLGLLDSSTIEKVEAETVNQTENEIDGWVAFTEEEKRFSQSFPLEPEYSLDNSGEFPYESYSNTIGDNLYYDVSLVTYDDTIDTSNPTVLLNEVLSMIVTDDSRNELLTSKNRSLNDLPIKEYEIRQEGVIVRGMIVLKENSIYFVTVSYLESEGEPEDADKFINSFKLL